MTQALDVVAAAEREKLYERTISEQRELLRRAAEALQKYEPEEPATSVAASIRWALGPQCLCNGGQVAPSCPEHGIVAR